MIRSLESGGTPAGIDPGVEQGFAPFDLTGRVAFVTGAGSGIGRSTAIILSRHRAMVVCADIDGDAAASTASGIAEEGRTAVAMSVDISVSEQVDSAIAKAASDFGRLDILANVAGISGRQCSLLDADESSIDRTFATNVKGTLFACQAAARVMAAAGGSIVNLASAAYDLAGVDNAIYGLSKAAVVFLTRSLALELAPRRIRVNAIAPGPVLTAMTARHFTRDGAIDDTMKRDWIESMIEMAPLGVVGAPDDIAYSVLYLASDASRLMTGQTIRPNGGIARPS